MVKHRDLAFKTKDCAIDPRLVLRPAGVIDQVACGEIVRAVEDHVVLKMDVEGFEYPIFDKLIDNGGLGLVDVLFLEAHHKGFSGSRFRGAAHLRAELRRRAPGLHVFEENRGTLRGFKFEGIDSKSMPVPLGALSELQRRCAEAKEVWVDTRS